ncbi:MAG: DUF4215 domain-containing protein, partial [Myxococcales bacterium]|nr:DUF4215 domain-containing protein [Myxococcales bacterium]
MVGSCLGVLGVVASCAKSAPSSNFMPEDTTEDAASARMGGGGADASIPDAAASEASLFVFVDAAAEAADSRVADGACDGDVCEQAPVPVCGDGIVNGTEQCDDGNAKSGDGCSDACRLEPGFACNKASPTVCHPTVCGDGKKEGFEQCDDGNIAPYDGCSPFCTIEPKCNGMGGCTGVCGDGLVIPPEECDDGNTNSGDGCSATCKLETGGGYNCTNVPSPPADSLDIPILYRDMLYHTSPAPLPNPAPPGGGHPDFNFDSFNIAPFPHPGLVFSPLAADGEPVLEPAGNVPQVITDATSFCWWFHDTGCAGSNSVNPYAKKVYLDKAGKLQTLHLTQTAAGSNIYTYSNQHFFPIDGLGWNAGTNPQTTVECMTTTPHNFSFTSEIHYVFTFDAQVAASATPAVFTFIGDDDVWAFINTFNVVDLGGMHDAAMKSITLDTNTASALGLVDGGFYAIDLFQAERHTCASTYKLTLSGFVHTTSTCTTTCGDGVVAGNEQCDDGVNNGSYGTCNANCTRAAFCGDATKQSPPEQCDDGVNLS